SVVGNNPTGTVSFNDGGTTLAGCSAIAVLSNATATCAVNNLTVGTHTIMATYSGDSANLTSSSSSLVQTVNKQARASTTNVSSSLNPSASGDSVTLTAQVSG